MHTGHLVAAPITNNQAIMQAQNLTIHLKDRLACFVQNSRILPKTEEFLTNHIAHRIPSFDRLTLSELPQVLLRLEKNAGPCSSQQTAKSSQRNCLSISRHTIQSAFYQMRQASW